MAVKRIGPAAGGKPSAVLTAAETRKASKSALPAVANASSIVEGEVVEVLPGFGLAHVRAGDGRVLGVTRQTPGVVFNQLRPGQRLRCRVTERFHRVLRADALS